MYYYVIEPGKGAAFRSRIEKIKMILVDFGISGEIVTASPARTSRELVEIGLAKGYSTIVAVGDEVHANRVATSLQGLDVAMGILPIVPDENLLELIDCEFDLKKMCLALKQRRLKLIDLGRIEPNKYFMTKVEIHEMQPIEIIGQFDDFFIQMRITELIITNDLYCYLANDKEGNGLIQKTWSYLLGKDERRYDQSLFESRAITINTRRPYPIKISNQIVARTPFTAVLKPKALQIIVSRARINQEIDSRSSL